MWEQGDFWEQPYSEWLLLILQEPVMQGSLAPPHVHLTSTLHWSCCLMEGGLGARGLHAQAAQGPLQISAGRAGTCAPWEEHRGIFPVSFPACVGVASHHGQHPVISLSITAGMVGPSPQGVPAVPQAGGERCYLEELQN